MNFETVMMANQLYLSSHFLLKVNPGVLSSNPFIRIDMTIFKFIFCPVDYLAIKLLHRQKLLFKKRQQGKQKKPKDDTAGILLSSNF